MKSNIHGIFVASVLYLIAFIFPVSRCDHYVHFQRVVKAFLINAIDDTFLCSLYGKQITSNRIVIQIGILPTRVSVFEEVVSRGDCVGLGLNLDSSPQICHFIMGLPTWFICPKNNLR